VFITSSVWEQTLSGATEPREEHRRTRCLVYLETDPGGAQVRYADGDPLVTQVLDAHRVHFTYAANIGEPDCLLPTAGLRWHPTRPPVLLDQYSFPTAPRTANNNRISQTFFKNDLLFTFDANNGIMVFRTTTDTTPDAVELTDFKKSSNGNFQFAYSNSAGWPYRVFGSSNLVNWQFAGWATQAWPGLFQFTDALTNRSRFYQLQWP